VGDLEVGVELLADAVTDEVAHDAELVGVRVVFDRLADHVERAARAHFGDRPLEARTRDVDQSARRIVDCISVHPLKMMNTPTAWKPRPDILNHANLRIVRAPAAKLLQSGGGSTPCWK